MRLPNIIKSRLLLRDGDFLAEVDILNGTQQRRTFCHWTLEGFAPADQAHAACTLVDYSGLHGFLQVVCATCAAGVDQSGAAHIAVEHLIAGQVDSTLR